MTLNGKQRTFLRAMAHHRPVVVSVGSRGCTETLISELEQALEYHELVKIKLPAAEKSAKRRMLNELRQRCAAEFVQLIGRTGVLFRPSENSTIKLPD